MEQLDWSDILEVCRLRDIIMLGYGSSSSTLFAQASCDKFRKLFSFYLQNNSQFPTTITTEGCINCHVCLCLWSCRFVVEN